MPLSISQKENIFDYILVRLAQWYIEENGLKSFAEFNNSNDFSKLKLALFPFFICTANGDRTILFENFDNFIADQYGLIEKDIKEGLNRTAIKFYKVSSFRTQFDYNNYQFPISSKSLTRDILDLLKIQADETIDSSALRLTDIIQGIDNSIDCIRYKRKIPFFVNISFENLSRHSKEHSSWTLFSSPRFLNLYEGKIPSEFLIKEKSVFASDVNDRVVA